jgi:hypothetical protein
MTLKVPVTLRADFYGFMKDFPCASPGRMAIGFRFLAKERDKSRVTGFRALHSGISDSMSCFLIRALLSNLLFKNVVSADASMPGISITLVSLVW